MIIKLFDKEISIRDRYCSFFGTEGSISEPYVNLYVRFRGCNADCLFCEYKEVANHFNFEKYDIVINEILKNDIELRKVALTGGEPTLNFNRFKDVVLHTRKTSQNTYISVNTNGINLVKMFDDGIVDELDNIALSRHHHNDKLNNKILGFKSVSNGEIAELQSRHNRSDLLHFSCNLVKGFVDTKRKAINFLEKANDLNVFSVGFVSLMPANDYCKDNFVDINTLDFKKNFFNSKRFDDFGYCMCRNYLYTPKDFKGQHVQLYLKNTYKNQEHTNSLIFDGEYLRYGFGDNNIIF